MKKYKIVNNDKLFHTVNYSLLTIIFLLTILPVLNMIANSFSSADAITKGQVFFWPVHPTLLGYSKMLESKFLLTGFLNSFIYTGLSTLTSVCITTMAAYSLSRKDLFGKKLLIWMFTFTMMFNGGLISTYILTAKYLGLKDTIFAMILPNAVAVWNLIITKTYFQSAIPLEMYEAAELDGTNDFQNLWLIALPLAKPVLAVITLYYAIWSWNSFFDALLYLTKAEMFPLQLTLRTIVNSSALLEEMIKTGTNLYGLANQVGISEILKYCLIVVSSIPVMILYPFVQKYFVRGIMIGSLK